MRLAIPAKFNSISVKILLAYVIGVALSIALMAGAFFLILIANNNILSQADVSDYTQSLANALVFDADGIPVAMRQDENIQPWLFNSLQQEVAYRVLDAEGKTVLASNASNDFWQGSEQVPLKAGTFAFSHNALTLDGATEIATHQQKTWYVQCAVSRRFMHFSHRIFALRFMQDGIELFALVLLFVFGLCAQITLWHTLKPLRKVSDAAAAISPLNLQARLQTTNVPYEIAPLVNNFNRALAQLETGYRRQKEFLATAAHELKTPLTLIRAQLELMDSSEEQRNLLQDTEYMSRQVQQLLLLAEASEALNYQRQDIKPADVAASAIDYLQRMAQSADVSLTLTCTDDDILWHADKGALFTLLKNLLENAIEHAPPHSQVQVALLPNELSVRDWGTGVDESQLPHLFERFWRGAHRRDRGAGLGLAICQEIALAHDWHLAASRQEPGLLITLTVA